MLRGAITVGVSSVVLLAGCGGGGGGGGGSQASVPTDDAWSRGLNVSVPSAHPLDLDPAGARLYALNQGGARLTVYDVPGLQVVDEIPIGPGACSVRRAPHAAGDEVWVVDHWTSSVTVVDVAAGRIERSIRVGARPVDLVFGPGGDRAYVSCAGAGTVDVVSTATYQVVASVPVPAHEPAALTWTAGAAWVLSMRSGNGTAAQGASAAATHDPLSIARPGAAAGTVPLPDRDLFAIPTTADPAGDVLDAARTVSGLGAVLFDVEARPGTGELWIANTEALNADHVGAASFVAGQVVQNRITVVRPAGGVPPRVIDLDALAPAGTGCAQPTGVAFSPDGSRAFVCGFGSGVVTVLDVSGTLGGGLSVQWAGEIVPPVVTDGPVTPGPRAALIDPTGQWLFAYDKLDAAVARIDLSTLPQGSGWSVPADLVVPLGHDLITREERRGRSHFAAARHSLSATSSCASCHVDGTTDGLVWDLSDFLDPEGTPPDQVHLEVDDKGPLATQSTQRLAETAPYHWRGERAGLSDFNATFRDLLENESDGKAAVLGGQQFPYIVFYVGRLAHAPNARQAPDRSLRPAEQRGAALFQHRRLAGGLTCATCHALPLGTSGEVVAVGGASKLRSLVVPSLRGVSRETAPESDLGGAFGPRPERGPGLLHAGTAASFAQAVRAHVTEDPAQPLTAEELTDLTAFLDAFDSGIAPAAAWQATAHAGNAATFVQDELAFLLDQAARGHCDVVCLLGRRAVPSGQAQVSGLYDVPSGRFELASTALPPRSPEGLVADAAAGQPVTFLGLPRGMGRTLGLDRDLDGARDLDELALGLDPERADGDGDGFPDGYELEWGLDPLVADASSPDGLAPALAAPVRLVLATQTALKLHVRTTEAVRLTVSLNGGHPIQRLPLPLVYDDEFSIVLGELQPETRYDVRLQLTDPAGNARDAFASFFTAARVFDTPVVVDALTADVVADPNGVAPAALALRATLALADGSPPPPGYVVELAVHHQRSDGTTVSIVQGARTPAVSGQGTVGLWVPLPSVAALGGSGQLTAVVTDVLAPSGAPPWIRAFDRDPRAKALY